MMNMDSNEYSRTISFLMRNWYFCEQKQSIPEGMGQGASDIMVCKKELKRINKQWL